MQVDVAGRRAILREEDGGLGMVLRAVVHDVDEQLPEDPAAWLAVGTRVVELRVIEDGEERAQRLLAGRPARA